ncbi:MAG: glycosyltransferase family 4 protein [Lachnospiraceae bacterium]|nr:glycosyltransferase family 4 protein [Lachnospiraceae bacterium]
MRLLIVTPGRLPIPAVEGGAVETLIQQILDYNEHFLHHEIYVAAIYHSEAVQRSRDYRYTHFCYLKMGRAFSLATKKHLLPYRMLDRLFAKKAVKQLRKTDNRFDYIVIENETVIGSVFLRYLEGSYIFHAHNNLAVPIRRKEQQFLQSCLGIIAISQYLENVIRGSIKPPFIGTVYNGIDINLFNRKAHCKNGIRIRERLGINKEETVILFAGRIIPEKGLEELLKAFAMLPETMPVTLLVLGASFFAESGENTYIKKLKSLGEKKKDKIVFCGYVEHSAMPDYYSAADIGCIPSIWEEPFGLAVAEQMAMQLPVITTESGAITEIADKSCGFVFPRDKDLSRNIADAVITLHEDKALRQKMGTAGRKIVCQHFSQQSYCENWFKMLEKMKGQGKKLSEKKIER